MKYLLILTMLLSGSLSMASTNGDDLFAALEESHTDMQVSRSNFKQERQRRVAAWSEPQTQTLTYEADGIVDTLPTKVAFGEQDISLEDGDSIIEESLIDDLSDF